MRLIEELEREHDEIDRALGALRAFVAARRRGEADAADGATFVRFFREYAGHHHHAREEQVLFPALEQALELRNDQGPIPNLTREHGELAVILGKLSAKLRDGAADEETEALAIAYSRGLWLHLDAENSVLLREAAFRLPRAGVHELPTPPPSAEALAALEAVRALVLRFPYGEDPGVIRGQGCIVCPSYGVTCDGLERAWWTASEWEEAADRAGNG